MKKTTFIIISLIMILTAVRAGFSATDNNSSVNKPGNDATRYLVNVNLTLEKQLCNTYYVVIRNGNGGLIAPAQPYRVGVKSYSFTERGPVTGKRVAALIRSPYVTKYVCDTELFTAPHSQNGTFLPGETYLFELYPKTQPLPH